MHCFSTSLTVNDNRQQRREKPRRKAAKTATLSDVAWPDGMTATPAPKTEPHRVTPQERDMVCAAVETCLERSLGNDEAEMLAKLAVEDTGLGNVPSKITKNTRKTFGTLRDLMRVKTVGVIDKVPFARCGRRHHVTRPCCPALWRPFF